MIMVLALVHFSHDTSHAQGPVQAARSPKPVTSVDVSPDGQRFLVIKTLAGSEPASGPASLVVVQSWLEQLRHTGLPC